MSEFPSKSYSARSPGVEIWRSTLLQIPTLFGRLVFVASLRDPASGHYYHPELAQRIGSEDADRSLCNSHYQVFQQWLGYSLAEQKSDLDEYLSDQSDPRRSLPYRKLIPPTAREVERQLYLADLETLLELLSYEHGGAFSTPEA